MTIILAPVRDIRIRLLALPVFAALLGAGCGSSRPEDAASQKAYGAQMARQGFWREALFRFERAAATAPNDAEVQNNLAVAYEAVGETARALAAYKKAIELAPADNRIKRNYARFAEYYTALQRSGGTTPGAPK